MNPIIIDNPLESAKRRESTSSSSASIFLRPTSFFCLQGKKTRLETISTMALLTFSFDQLNEYCFDDVLKYLPFSDLIQFGRVNSKWKANIMGALKRLKVFKIDHPLYPNDCRHPVDICHYEQPPDKPYDVHTCSSDCYSIDEKYQKQMKLIHKLSIV